MHAPSPSPSPADSTAAPPRKADSTAARAALEQLAAALGSRDFATTLVTRQGRTPYLSIVSNPAQSIRDSGPLIRHFQLCDTNRLEPGAGHLDWPACLDALADIGYDGWLAMECRLSGPPVEVPRVSALLKR